MLEKNNYFSIQEIFATQTRASCTFLQDVPAMGKLNPSGDSDDLRRGTNIELPIWIVNELIKGNRPLIVPILPKVYKESYREILKADPNAVDLSKLSNYYYHVGNHVKDFNRNDKQEVVNTLRNTFKERFRQLMDLAYNTNCSVSAVTKLDRLERELFEDAYDARKKLTNWLVETGIKLEAASIVINHKKRKRDDYQQD